MKTFHLFLKSTLIACLLLIAFSNVAVGQDGAIGIRYHLAMSNPNSHLFEVSIEVQKPPDVLLDTLDFQMPKWSPGRYAVFDFAKNVQEVRTHAECPPGLDCKLPAPPLMRLDDQTWRVDITSFKSKGLNVSGPLSVFLDYKVFGNDLSGTFSQLDSHHANINGGCIFMYVVGHKQDSVSLSINPPKDWRIVNGRSEKKDQGEFQFPNWDMMIDTSTEIAPDWTEDNFTVDGKIYHVVVHSMGGEGGKRPALVSDIEKIVRAETGMWGPPDFDSYTFLLHFAGDGHSSDGMEHLTSTEIILPGALADADTYGETLDAVAHEFFHVWNVKRLRPVELGPWDFTRPVNTRALWIAEGITNYYGHLMQRRAGLWDDKKFLQALTEQITEVENAPGARLMSAEESSLSAPFIDDAPHAQQTNLANSSVSYYSKGESLGIVLDLLIRGRTSGKLSLDEVMRRMYDEFYLKSPNATYYLRGRGYQNQDFERMVSQVAATDMSDFFKRYVQGVEPPPYEQAFAQVGLRFIREPRAPVAIGITGDESEKVNFKVASVRSDSPAAQAGLQVGDVIKTFDGRRLTPDNFLTTIGRYRPGNHVELIIHRDRRSMQIMLTLGSPQIFDYRIEEEANASQQAKALRVAWVNGK
ncbi:MAG: M61 family metallopeptidase [Pyrinomonadaceae bacterium]